MNEDAALLRALGALSGLRVDPARLSFLRQRLDPLLAGADGELELRRLSDACIADAVRGVLTIPKTAFFRVPELYEQLAGLLPALRRRAEGRPLRVWCAGCSTGQEAWSLLSLITDTGPPGARLLATDLVAQRLESTRRGCYRAQDIEQVPESRRHDFLLDGDRLEPRPGLRELLDTRRHDLLREPPPGPPELPLWDIISCRNVLIYAAQEQIRPLLEDFHRVMQPEGILILGQSEVLCEAEDLFRVELGPETFLYRPLA